METVPNNAARWRQTSSDNRQWQQGMIDKSSLPVNAVCYLGTRLNDRCALSTPETSDGDQRNEHDEFQVLNAELKLCQRIKRVAVNVSAVNVS